MDGIHEGFIDNKKSEIKKRNCFSAESIDKYNLEGNIYKEKKGKGNECDSDKEIIFEGYYLKGKVKEYEHEKLILEGEYLYGIRLRNNKRYYDDI